MMIPTISEPEPVVRLPRDVHTAVDASARFHCMIGYRPIEMGECGLGTVGCGRRRTRVPSAPGCRRSRPSRVFRGVYAFCVGDWPVSRVLPHLEVQSGLCPTFRPNRRSTGVKSVVCDFLVSGPASLQFLCRRRVLSCSGLRYSACGALVAFGSVVKAPRSPGSLEPGISWPDSMPVQVALRSCVSLLAEQVQNAPPYSP